MALIIDGTTYKGFWKLTPDNASADVWYMVPKDNIIQIPADATGGKLRLEADPAGNNFDINYDATCIDGDGNALATSAAIANYISQNR